MNQAKTRPTIGLALGSGAARGWSHIGVIRALEEIGLRPDVVTGTSIGAVVAAAFAAGKLDVFEAWVRSLDRPTVLRLMDTRFSGTGGFIQGVMLMKALEKIIGNPDIETLDVPFGCVATQFGTGREVWLRKGKLLDAVRASIALPGLVAPVQQNDHLLLDGGLVNPVPVSLTRAMGVDIVIAVNLNGDLVGHDFFAMDLEEAPQALTATDSERTPEEFELDIDEDEGLLDKWTERIKLGIALRLDSWLSSALRSEENSPGLLAIIIGAIDIMQDRITRARMAGEPPDVHIVPRLRHIGVMDFDRADIAISEGHQAVRRETLELTALRKALTRFDDEGPDELATPITE